MVISIHAAAAELCATEIYVPTVMWFQKSTNSFIERPLFLGVCFFYITDILKVNIKESILN